MPSLRPAMTVLSPCPACGGQLTERDVICDMHLDSHLACGCSFPSEWTPEVDYEVIESDG